jgi:hypothetical protein
MHIRLTEKEGRNVKRGSRKAHICRYFIWLPYELSGVIDTVLAQFQFTVCPLDS